jgi:2-C-methyl-D-erythritol 4-phosphate cytidylyltransferase
MRTVAVVLAAGSGQRFGGELPKQLQRLAGRTLIEHSVGAFQDAPGVDAILLVVSPDLAGPVATARSPGSSRAARPAPTRPAGPWPRSVTRNATCCSTTPPGR